MGCGATLVKYILFATNLIFALGGLALLGLGIAAQLQVTAITNIVEGNFQVAPIFTIVVGAVVFVVSFFGCCGAIRENNCMLITYAVFMLILMALKIALATYIFVKLPKLDSEVPKLLEPAFNVSDLGPFHEIERTLDCCGTIGPKSYTLASLQLPPSCCPSSAAEAPANQCTLNNAYQGCNAVLVEFLKYFGMVIGAFVLVIAAIELVAVVFGCCLSNHVRNNQRRSHY